MNADFKLYARLGAKSGALWLLVVVCGVGAAFTFLCLALYDAWDSVGWSAGGMEFIQAYAAKHWPSAVSILGAPFFALIAIAVANKVAIQTVLFGLWSSKAVHQVEAVLRRDVDRYFSDSNPTQVAAKLAELRSGLLKVTKDGSVTSKIIQRVIKYALRKIDLDGIDPHQPDFNAGDVIARRVSDFVAESTEPSLRPLWILIAVQAGVYACSKMI